jgi:hypothetical protein
MVIAKSSATTPWDKRLLDGNPEISQGNGMDRMPVADLS